MSCVFCAIVAGDAPAIRIYENDDYLAILDIRPFTRGHTLVIPKRHTVDLTDTQPETVAQMVTIGQRIARAARATVLADATNIGINDGRAAFSRCSTFTCTCCPAATATSSRWPGACCCGATRTGKAPDSSCGTRWRGSTRIRKTGAMSSPSPLEHATLRFLALHDSIYQKTGGWLGHRIPGMPPNLLLHTVGAKTGQPRTNTLTYARDGDAYLIVGSNAGAKRHTGWYHNLRNRPDCEINVGPKRFAVTAR